jgi:hypothetical protein
MALISHVYREGANQKSRNPEKPPPIIEIASYLRLTFEGGKEFSRQLRL